MKIEEVKGILATSALVVEARPTKELFPHSIEGGVLTHFSLVCQSHADQHRVHHWIQFHRADFEGFDCWAVYVEAITDRGPYSSPEQPFLNNAGFPGLGLPPGVVC